MHLGLSLAFIVSQTGQFEGMFCRQCVPMPPVPPLPDALLLELELAPPPTPELDALALLATVELEAPVLLAAAELEALALLALPLLLAEALLLALPLLLAEPLVALLEVTVKPVAVEVALAPPVPAAGGSGSTPDTHCVRAIASSIEEKAR